MEPLVQRRVFRVDINFAVRELQPLCRLLVEDDVERDFLDGIRRKERVLLHFLPRGPQSWILLHRLAEELEAAQRNFDVLRPRPSPLFDLRVELLQRHLVRRLLCHVEDEHTGKHLVKYHADGPDVDLVAVACAGLPVCFYLLGRHHQGRTLEREGTIVSRFAPLRPRLELPRVPQVSDFDDESFRFEVDLVRVNRDIVRSVREVN